MLKFKIKTTYTTKDKRKNFIKSEKEKNTKKIVTTGKLKIKQEKKIIYTKIIRKSKRKTLIARLIMKTKHSQTTTTTT